MSTSLEKKEVSPFCPRPFPPKNLSRKSFDPLLQKANGALREFCAALNQVPPLIKAFPPLLKIEALYSQRIGVSLKEFLLSSKKKRVFVQIRDYVEAFNWACPEIAQKPFSKKQICQIHKMIKRASAQKPDLGRYRNRQNWIGPSGCTIEQAYFYPPAAESVDQLMNQLFCYMKRSDKEPLLQLALILAQLLIIHPFMDGNGRIARLLIPLFLYKKKVLPSPFFFLSGYFKYRRLRYFQTLFKTTKENNWEEWIRFFLRGIRISAKKQTRTLMHIASLYENAEFESKDA
jgi:Fic family protein